jgi:outer membrane protein
MRKILYLGLLLCVQAADSAAAADAPTVHLTLAQAQEIALRQNPRIHVADLLALAEKQKVIEARAPFYPAVFANATAVGAGDPNNTRLAAGALNNPIVFDREADGLTISQLITDFGRTWDLTQSAQANSRAQAMNQIATHADILLALDHAFFATLQAQAVLEVAAETVSNRNLIFEQTQALVTNKLKSELDLKFATVDLDQARVFLAKSQSDLSASYASLTAILGEREPRIYQLVDEPMPPPSTNDISTLVFEALGNRPELARARYQRDAAMEFAKAENKLSYPIISGMAAAGVIPERQAQFTSGYAAAGVNINLPIFVGGLYRARAREAKARASALDESLRDEEDTIVRDVQISKLNLDYSLQHLALAESLLANANETLTLAQARFKIGSASIIELSQAELNQTSAQIEATNAKYDFHIQRASLDFQLGRLR